MYPRKEIIKNQRLHEDDIAKWLKEDFKQTKEELKAIQSSKGDDIVKEAQKKLLTKAKKVKINEEIKKFFIHEDNIYPKFYAWWDEEIKTTVIYKYTDEAR